MLIEVALGDAFGAGFEYAHPKFVQKHNDVLKGYQQHPKWEGMEPGHYTDDTQMQLGLAELMLAKDVARWTPYDVAKAFLETFRRDPREGYAQGFWDLLDGITQAHGSPATAVLVFMDKILPHSAKSGGAMRAGVLGLLPDLDDAADRARFQASLTHATTDGMNAAAAAALIVHYCYYKLGHKANLASFLDDICPLAGPRWRVPWKNKISAPGLHSVRAAVTMIVQHDSLSDILQGIVGLYGDTDTAAAIAMAAASVSDEVDQDLPEVLHEGLENGEFGYDYLAQVDTKLLTKYPRDFDTKEDEGE
jgi:ADP-ribosyl-[dinitrogen reductase] hydrolase